MLSRPTTSIESSASGPAVYAVLPHVCSAARRRPFGSTPRSRSELATWSADGVASGEPRHRWATAAAPHASTRLAMTEPGRPSGRSAALEGAEPDDRLEQAARRAGHVGPGRPQPAPRRPPSGPPGSRACAPGRGTRARAMSGPRSPWRRGPPRRPTPRPPRGPGCRGGARAGRTARRRAGSPPRSARGGTGRSTRVPDRRAGSRGGRRCAVSIVLMSEAPAAAIATISDGDDDASDVARAASEPSLGDDAEHRCCQRRRTSDIETGWTVDASAGGRSVS